MHYSDDSSPSGYVKYLRIGDSYIVASLKRRDQNQAGKEDSYHGKRQRKGYQFDRNRFDADYPGAHSENRGRDGKVYAEHVSENS